MKNQKKSPILPWVLPIVKLIGTVLSPILEKKNAKRNAELSEKGELPKIEVSASRVTQIGGTGGLMYIGYELIQLGQINLGVTLIIVGAVIGAVMEYFKRMDCNCPEEIVKE